jgi:hypothetical protein
MTLLYAAKRAGRNQVMTEAAGPATGQGACMKRLAYLQQQNPHWREEADLTRYFVDAAYQSIAPAVCSTPLLAWIAYGDASLWRMLCWMGLFWLVEWRLILVVRQYRQHDTHPLSVYQYYPAVRDCLLASSLLWGSCIWFMAPTA